MINLADVSNCKVTIHNKVTFTLNIGCSLCCFILIQNMKCVGSMEFEIHICVIVWKKYK